MRMNEIDQGKDKQGPRLLVVDDDPDIAEVLHDRLEAEGYRVDIASDGVEALECMRRVEYNLALVDLQMPRMGGMEMLGHLEEEGIEVTTVVITAFGTIAKAVEAMRAGAYDFITKPFDPAQIRIVVDRALERVRLQQTLEEERLAKERLRQEMIERDLLVARTIQRSFLPSSLPVFPGFAFEADYEPALEVGGDFYDFIPISEERLAFVIGDVSGKGIASALFMAKLISDIRYTSVSSDGPVDFLSRLNRAVFDQAQMGMFVTLFYGIINSSSGKIWFGNAGHLPPIVKREGKVERIEHGSAPPLGIQADQRFEAGEVSLAGGEVLVVFTDGVLEARSAHVTFGRERLERSIAEAPAAAGGVQDAVQRSVLDFMGGQTPLQDDFTLMSIGRAISGEG